MALQPVILAGGSGTRLWPLSRDSTPKQFISLRGERSLLQETVARLDGLEDAAAPLLVCNERHRSLVASQLDAIGIRPTAVIFETVGRNTAPALTLAALGLRDGCDAATATDPVMLVLPADHMMKDVQSFQSAVRQGGLMAARGYLVAVGVIPTSPHSGYGYIRTAEAVHEPTGTSLAADEPRAGKSPAVRRVVGFVEKPDPTTARSSQPSRGP